MPKQFGRILLWLFLLALSTSCNTESELGPFSSDGCSLFPDSFLISESDWCSCCFEHDLLFGAAEPPQKASRLIASLEIASPGKQATKY